MLSVLRLRLLFESLQQAIRRRNARWLANARHARVHRLSKAKCRGLAAVVAVRKEFKIVQYAEGVGYSFNVIALPEHEHVLVHFSYFAITGELFTHAKSHAPIGGRQN